jgi:hypothetical protein
LLHLNDTYRVQLPWYETYIKLQLQLTLCPPPCVLSVFISISNIIYSNKALDHRHFFSPTHISLNFLLLFDQGSPYRRASNATISEHSTFVLPLLNAMSPLSSHIFLHNEEIYDLNNSKFISHVTSQVVKMCNLFYNWIHLHNFVVDWIFSFQSSHVWFLVLNTVEGMVHPDFVSDKRGLHKLYTRCEEQYDRVWKVVDLGNIFPLTY